MGSLPLSTGTWDTHVHVLDPERFAFSSGRTYTPPAALATDLFAASPVNNFLLVQATIEGGSEGLLHHLNALSASEPSKTFRGALIVNLSNIDEDVAILTSNALKLHSTGVRCLRIHAQWQSSSNDLIERITSILKGPIAAIAREFQWCISMRLPLETWAALTNIIETHCSDISIIAEHCGCFNWPLPEAQAAPLATFLDMLRHRLVYVKLGALHRRLEAGHPVSDIGAVIQQLADAGPRRLLWGSDWPHVDTEAKGMIEAPFLEVDETAELDVVRRSMTEVCFNDMLVTTPESLFR